MTRSQSDRRSPQSFGAVISNLRQLRGLNQKEFAARLLKEDGSAISPQYLNDIERDRRQAPGTYLLHQMAAELGITREAIEIIAGRVPESLQSVRFQEPARIDQAVHAFSRALSRRRRGRV